MSDYISREAAIERIRVAAGCAECDGPSCDTCGCDFCTIHTAIYMINRLPAADVEPVRHGPRKVWGIDEYYGEWLLCQNCGYSENTASAKCCGGCGAKLDLEE